jgi:hypothetical protein
VVLGECRRGDLAPDLAWLQAQLQGPRPPKMVVLSNPCNPTGVLLTEVRAVEAEEAALGCRGAPLGQQARSAQLLAAALCGWQRTDAASSAAAPRLRRRRWSGWRPCAALRARCWCWTTRTRRLCTAGARTTAPPPPTCSTCSPSPRCLRSCRSGWRSSRRPLLCRWRPAAAARRAAAAAPAALPPGGAAAAPTAAVSSC